MDTVQNRLTFSHRGLLLDSCRTDSARAQMTLRSGSGGGAVLPPGPRLMHVHHDDTAFLVQYHSSTSDMALRDAVAAAVDLAPGSFGLRYSE